MIAFQSGLECDGFVGNTDFRPLESSSAGGKANGKVRMKPSYGWGPTHGCPEEPVKGGLVCIAQPSLEDSINRFVVSPSRLRKERGFLSDQR